MLLFSVFLKVDFHLWYKALTQKKRSSPTFRVNDSTNENVLIEDGEIPYSAPPPFFFFLLCGHSWGLEYDLAS